MRGAIVASLAALSFLFLSSVPAARSPAEDNIAEFEKAREVRHVQIHGNQAFSDRKLRKFLRTRGKSFWKPWHHSPYRPDFLRFDRVTLQSYYRRRGYLQAQVDSVRTDPVPESASEVDVNFFLTEGQLWRVRAVVLPRTAPLQESDVRKVLKGKPLDPVDITSVEADRLAIEDYYANLGYAAVEVRDSLAVDSTRVNVVYKIDPGPVVKLGKVEVDGIRRTRRRVVTRELTVRPGEILARKKLADSQQRIYDTGLYSDVVFERGNIDSATSVADLLLTVRERKMAWVDGGLGYGTLDQLRLTTEWGHRNLGHEGIRFTVSGRMGVVVTNPVFPVARWKLGNRRVDASVSQPWTFGTRTQATLGGYAEEVVRTQTGVRRFLERPLRANGAALAFRRNLTRETRGTFSLEHRHVLSDSALPLAAGVEKSSYTTRRVGLSVERDTRVNPFDPKAGSDLIGNMVVAGGVLQGSARFTKFSVGASAYLPVRRRYTLAMRIQSGYVNPFGHYGTRSDTLRELELIPQEDRFVTGGASSVRGYFENEIGFRASPPDSGFRGGEVLLLGSVEARFPLVWILSGAVFMDAGNVWERPEDITLKRIFTVTGPGAGYSDMRWSVGAGVRIATPVGPVRFDYGWKLRRAKREEGDLSSTRGTFHFSLGQAF